MAECLPPGITAAEVRRDQAIDDRMRIAFGMALRARHECAGQVVLHLGADVLSYLKSLARFPDHGVPFERATCWGFPIIESDDSPDHISVHTVQTIF